MQNEKISNLAAIYIYGSAVKSLLRKDTDIDIAILPVPNISKDEVLSLISLIEDLVSRTLFKLGIKNRKLECFSKNN